MTVTFFAFVEVDVVSLNTPAQLIETVHVSNAVKLFRCSSVLSAH
jgi:hypothetical protein